MSRTGGVSDGRFFVPALDPLLDQLRYASLVIAAPVELRDLPDLDRELAEAFELLCRNLVLPRDLSHDRTVPPVGVVLLEAASVGWDGGAEFQEVRGAVVRTGRRELHDGADGVIQDLRVAFDPVRAPGHRNSG